MLRITGLLLLPLSLVACKSAQDTTKEGPPPASSSADQVVVSELSYSVEGLTAYDLVTRKNSNWLQKRGSSSISGPGSAGVSDPVPVKVSVDGLERESVGTETGSTQVSGGTNAAALLRTIDARDIAVIEYFDGQAAQQKFGIGHGSGVIAVRTR